MKVEEECDAARKTRGMEESEGPRATRWKSRNEANRGRGTQSAQRLRSKIEQNGVSRTNVKSAREAEPDKTRQVGKKDSQDLSTRG